MESTMSPYFGIVVSLAAFGIGTFLFKKTKGFFLFTPLFVAMVLGIAFLKIGGFSYADYNNGERSLSFSLNRQRSHLQFLCTNKEISLKVLVANHGLHYCRLYLLCHDCLFAR